MPAHRLISGTILLSYWDLSLKLLKQLELTILGFQGNNFENIMIMSSRIKTLDLKYCKIDSNNLKFSNKVPFRLESLIMKNCGIQIWSGWDQTPSKLASIISAISKSSLLMSLRKIDIGRTRLSRKTLKKMINKYKLNEVTVTAFNSGILFRLL